ncbi:MAG TPA: DUF1071 domain-containing protein [Methanosarcina sp.]|nr:DUF1071 domain-containing protein [Methanosarcina sp.]
MSGNSEKSSEKKMENKFIELAKIDCSDKIEKKNGLSYLSWAWAVDQLMRHDPGATWEFHAPTMYGSETMMVSCTVTAFGKPMKMYLPVMDYRNKAISNPDAFAINTAMMRCLVKGIALHGLGLYIYAGEDLPESEKFDVSPYVEAIKNSKTLDELKTAFNSAQLACKHDKDALKQIIAAKDTRKLDLEDVPQ